MSVVTPLRGGRMTESEYDRERERLRDLYGDSNVEAIAKRDQALAILFDQSGWTQEELAAKEGKSQQQIARQLRFGRFLNFTPAGVNPESLPKNFTERKFRNLWDRTNKDLHERIRFNEVLQLIKTGSTIVATRRHPIGQQIKDKFADGHWHAVTKIAETLELDEEHVHETLRGMAKNGTYQVKAETKTVGRVPHFKLYPLNKNVSVAELTDKLLPIIQELETEGRQSLARVSPTQIAILAAKLRKLLKEWAQ